MSLQEDIKAELKVSIKARDKARTGVVRILIGEFQRLPEKELSDDQVVGIIKKLIKSERELLAASGEKSSDYITILEGYLPKQASEEEIKDWIMENIDFSSFKNKMQAMRLIMTHFGSSADGTIVKKILQDLN